jgi:hypothetical protein
MANNMNGSQKFLQAYHVEWPRLKAAKAAGAKITKQDLPSDQEVQAAFNERMCTRESAGV